MPENGPRKEAAEMAREATETSWFVTGKAAAPFFRYPKKYPMLFPDVLWTDRDDDSLPSKDQNNGKNQLMIPVC